MGGCDVVDIGDDGGVNVTGAHRYCQLCWCWY